MADFTPLEAPARDAQSLPVSIPGKPVGRDESLKQIYAELKANKVALIHGPAGMGKTSLAATLAGAYAQQPGGVLWFNVADSPLDELIVRVGRAYRVAEITGSDTPLAMLGAAANTLMQHKPLVVLDGPINPGVAANFVTKCVAGLPALIVSEEHMEGPWTAVELGKLDPDSAAAMFKQQSGLTDHTHDIDVFGIVKLLEHSPFAVAVAARGMLASKQAPGDYFRVLQQTASAAGGSGQLTALTASYRALNGALQGLILMMGAAFGGRASAELLSTISGAAQDSVQQAMNVLSQLYLVERTLRYGAPYYRLHSIIYSFAQNFLRGSGRLEGLQSKVRDSVVAYARKYSAADEQSHDKLVAEMESLLAVALWAGDQGDRDTANQLVVALTQAGDFVSTRGYLYELLRLRGIGTGFATAFPAYAPGPGVREGELFDDDQFEEELEELEELEEEAEEFEEEIEAFPEAAEAFEADELAHLRTDLARARQQGDTARQVELLKSIGKAQVGQKMENEAIATYTEALDLYEAQDNSAGVLEMLDMLSSLMTKTENSQAAVLHATRGIKLAQELNDDETRMHLLVTLGDARQQLGESEEAERNFNQALTVARTRSDGQNEALILYKLGYAQLDNGDAQTAVETWEQALALFKDQKKRDYEGRVLGALGSAYGELERWSEAVNFHTSALYIAREVADGEEEALQLGNLGYAAVQTSQLGDAVLRYRQALHLHYESKNRENIVSTIVDLVRLLVESRRHLSVAELLIDDALRLEPNDRELRQLKERITHARDEAAADGVDFVAVLGTAQDYAFNAYKLLDQ